MPYQAKVVMDSISKAGARLTTVEVQVPLPVWNQFMAHRQFSRNAASNRAIPSKAIIEWVEMDPYEPLVWGKNCKGMQSWEELTGADLEKAKSVWRMHREQSLSAARNLNATGLHKQWSNRVLSPHQWIKAVLSSTTWANLFKLRLYHDVQPESHDVARRIYEAVSISEPVLRTGNEWHLPYTTVEERNSLPIEVLKKISTARLARVSYLTHEGVRDLDKDIELHDSLLKDTHMSPFEHVAWPSEVFSMPSGNFNGWHQYRKEIAGEVCINYKGVH